MDILGQPDIGRLSGCLYSPERPAPRLCGGRPRNTRLIAACTHDGLLHGGPHYQCMGNPPCTSYITHTNALASALECGAVDDGSGSSIPLPGDHPAPLRHYPEIDTWKIAVGDWSATVTFYDFVSLRGMRPEDSVLLWHARLGPVSPLP
jgi:hypothetical protein